MQNGTIENAAPDDPASVRSREQIMALLAHALAAADIAEEAMSAILERIGIPEQDVRIGFGDIESLIVAIAQREAWLMSEPLVTWRSGTADGFARALMRFGCIAAGEYTTRLVGFVRMMTVERARYPALGRKVYDVGPAFVTLKLREFLWTGNRCGVFSIADPQLAAEQLMGLLREPLYAALTLSPTHDAQARELRVVENITRFFDGTTSSSKAGGDLWTNRRRP